MTINNWGSINTWGSGSEGNINTWGPINQWGGGGVTPDGFEIALQSAIYNLMLNTGYPIYDDVPQPNDTGNPADFPYLVIGDDSFSNWDTDSEDGMTALVTIHSWSRLKGKKEIKEMQAAVYTLLQNYRLTYPNYHFLQTKFVSSDNFNDVDGETHHGVSIFRVYFERI